MRKKKVYLHIEYSYKVIIFKQSPKHLLYSSCQSANILWYSKHFKIHLRKAFRDQFTWNYVSGHGQVAPIGTSVPKMTTINSGKYTKLSKDTGQQPQTGRFWGRYAHPQKNRI